MQISDATLLQIIKLKGMVTAAEISAASGHDFEAVETTLRNLEESGLISEAKSRYRVTPEGKSKLAAWLDNERREIDGEAIHSIYEEFHPLNTEFKALATNWQIRNGEPNDHSDESYDRGILLQLADLHQAFMPLVGRVAALAPRLTHYIKRFDAALNNIESGDHTYFLRPIIDSYHTLWFELHEDLIGLTGKSRVDEAAAGRAD